MKNESHSRAYREGWIGRRRTYRCRQCPNKFQVDTLNPLPEEDRLCPKCKENNLAIRIANTWGNWESFKGGDAKQQIPTNSTST